MADQIKTAFAANKQEVTSRLIRLREVLSLIGVSRSTWYDWIAKGKAKPPVKLGAVSAWPLGEVEALISKQIQQSRGSA